MDPEVPPATDFMVLATDLSPSGPPAPTNNLDSHDPMEVTRELIAPPPDSPLTLPLASGNAGDPPSTDNDSSSSSDENDRPVANIRQASGRVIPPPAAPLNGSGPARFRLDNHTQVQSAADLRAHREPMPTLILYSGSALDSVQVSTSSLHVQFKWYARRHH